MKSPTAVCERFGLVDEVGPRSTVLRGTFEGRLRPALFDKVFLNAVGHGA